MSKTKRKTPQPVASINPIKLIEMLGHERHFEAAWRSYLAGQMFFVSGGVEEYKDLIQVAFKAMFSTGEFQKLDESEQARQMNMGVQLMILLDSIGELNDSTNNAINRSLNNELPQN